MSLGIQALLTGLAFAGAPSRPALTIVGQIGFKPEWDGVLYVLSGALGVVFAVVFCLAPPGRWPSLPRVGTVGQLAVALVALGASLGGLRYARHHLLSGADVPVPYLLLFLGLMAATVTAGLLGGGAPAARSVADVMPGRSVRWPVDLLFVAAVVAVIYQPGSTVLAGATFQLDAMLHWDYFAMGTTLAFGAGAALGTDVQVFYGMGWPLLFDALAPAVPVSYANMIQAAQIYGCLYLVGAYAFLRLFVRRAAWAMTGVVLVLAFHVFARSAAAFAPYWGFPSLSLVRYTVDVWFFAVLVLSLRSGRRVWDGIAGVLVGVAVLFELDTGFYLAAAMVLFWLCRAVDAPDRRMIIRRATTATACAAAVLLAGLAVASRGTLLRADFWSGWLENLRATASGFSMEPLATGTPGWTIAALVLTTAVYLLLVGHAVVGAIRHRITAESLVLGTLAGYGFLVTLYFVGRSTPYNQVRSSVPFALVLAALGARGAALGAAWLAARGADGERRWWSSPWAARAPGVVALGLAVALLVGNPVFRGHRGLARVALDGGGRQAEGLCVLERPKDLCGIAPGAVAVVGGTRMVADRLRQLAAHGELVAVLDQTGPLLHLASGTSPWGRYSPLLLSLYTPQRLESVKRELESDPPDVVVIRSADIPLFQDTMTVLRAVVRDRFEMDSELAGYQIWRLRSRPATG